MFAFPEFIAHTNFSTKIQNIHSDKFTNPVWQFQQQKYRWKKCKNTNTKKYKKIITKTQMLKYKYKNTTRKIKMKNTKQSNTRI